MKLAISGKGGVGKTTIAAALIKSLSETCSTVFAIDGDPDACLAAAIGIPEEVSANLKPVVEMREAIRSTTGQGAFYVLNPTLDDETINQYCYTYGNIKFARMGDAKKGGSECYCRENTFLNALVSALLLDKKEVVVMDMGAGIEHLSRGTARGVEIMLVVVEPSKNSVNTARHVMDMAKDLGIAKVKIIGNKIRSKEERDFIEKSFQPGSVLGFIEFNDAIWKSAMEPEQSTSEGLLIGMREVREKILREAGGDQARA